MAVPPLTNRGQPTSTPADVGEKGISPRDSDIHELVGRSKVSILRMPPSERRTRLVERMTLSHDQHFGIPIVAVEETMRGWLAAIAKERLARRHVKGVIGKRQGPVDS